MGSENRYRLYINSYPDISYTIYYVKQTYNTLKTTYKCIYITSI